MPDLTSSDVSVAVNAGDRDLAGSDAFKNFTLATITFGDGSKTYPANGVPLPDIGKFGFKKEIAFGIPAQNPDNGLLYKYDRTHHSIRIWTQGFATGATGATTAGNGALVKNSSGVEGTPRISNTAASTTYDMGQMIELPVARAPVSVSLQLLLIGE